MRQRPCLDDDEVQALALGALSAEAATPMLEHVGTCDVCRVLVATLARRPTPPLWDADTLPASGAGAAPVLSQGARIDRYVVEDHVGQGGMGVVYAAYDPQLDRRVALKVVRSDRAQSLELRQRLVREAQVMARVSHPNVVTVYDAGIVDDQVFIAMELVDGSTLTEWLRAEPRSWRQVVEPFADAGRGLAAAHAIGIVHRDFKPDNVLVGKDGRVRVSDFGLAIAEASPEATANAGAPRAGGGAARLTGDGRLVGTPAYMAPEQRSGGVVDARTDQFSFCVALHEALFGVLPGGAGPPAAREPRARGRVPREVRRVIARGLSPSPAARFPSMDALLDRLGRCAAPPRRPTAALFGALALTALIGAGATSTFVRHARREAAPHAFARSVHRLTYSPGCEEYPSFVSKSSVLVFDGDVDGAQQLFTLDVATRAVRQLTVGPAAHRAAVVSPDGRRAVYEHKLDGPREIRLMELDGHGEERSLGPGTSVGASWLDDHRLVIAPGTTPLELDVDVPGATSHPLHPDPEQHRVGLTAPFSDGTLATIWWAPPSDLGVGLLSPSGLTVMVDRMPYTDGALSVAPGEDAFYFVRRAGVANELVRMPRRGGTPEVVPGGIAPARGIAIARDGERLVFSTCVSRAQLARIGDGSRATPLFRWQPWSDISPKSVDAHRLLFTSDRSSHDQLYVTDVGGAGEPRAVSERDVEQGSPSRDGLWIVYAAHDPGGLWIVPVDGSAPPRRLTDGAHDEAPTFSRDGATVYFAREDGAFAVSREGGAPRRIAPAPARELTASPVDDRIFFQQRSQPDRVRIMVVDGKGAVAPLDVPIPPGNYWSTTIAPDGKTLALVHDGYEVLEVPLDGRGPVRVRTRLSQWITSLSYTFDGQALWASLESLDGDLWIADGEFR